MSLNVKTIKTESNFVRPPALGAGTYPAAPVQVLGLGLQEQRPFKGEAKPPKQEVMITYEMSDEFLMDEEGEEDLTKPRWVNETFPLNSLDVDLATSTKRYNAIDPDMKFGGDFSQLVGVPCLIVLSASPSKKDPDVIYNNVTSVNTMRAKDAAKMDGLVNPSKVFDFYEPDMEVFNSIPEWIQNKMKDSLDYGGSDLEALVNGGDKGKEPAGKAKASGAEEGGDSKDADDEDGW